VKGCSDVAEIRVERTLPAPPEHVFEVLADHAGYTRFRGITRAELVRPGDSEPNGVGALRKVASGPLVFTEEITAFEPPSRLDYLIVDVNFPVAHEGGSIRIDSDPRGSHVLWTSVFRVTTRVASRPLESALRLMFAQGFSAMLSQAGKSPAVDRDGAAAGRVPSG
jgi:uncharacterized protein YndB with AHSA1/START domain